MTESSDLPTPSVAPTPMPTESASSAEPIATFNPQWDGQRFVQWDGQRWLTWDGAAWVDASVPYGATAPYGVIPRGPQNGLGTAALVLGILAVLFALTPITYLVSVVLAPVAIILGFVGRSRVKSGEADNKGAAVAGIVMGFIAVAACIFWFVFWIVVINGPVHSTIDTIEKASKALTGIGVRGGTAPTGLGQTIQYDDGLTITIDNAGSFTPSPGTTSAIPGGTNLIFRVSVKNGTSSAYSPLLFNIDASAGSPLKDCEQIFDTGQGIDSLNSLSIVPPGEGRRAKVGFACPAAAGSALKVEVTPGVVKYQRVTQAGTLGDSGGSTTQPAAWVGTR